MTTIRSARFPSNDLECSNDSTSDGHRQAEPLRDLRARKKTLPVVEALTSGTAEGAELAEGTGGRSWSREQAVELLAGALRDLRASNPAPIPAAELEELARRAIGRDS